MKKMYFSFFLFFSFLAATRAQYVTIPDVHFRTYLQTTYPASFNGAGLLDTTSAEILSVTKFNIPSIPLLHDLDGIQYFKSLDTLIYTNGPLWYLSKLPPDLKYLDFSFTGVTTLPEFPASLKFLKFNNTAAISQFTSLPPALEYLYCSQSNRVSLPTLPLTLKELDVSMQGISVLPALPASLENLNAEACWLSSIPALPAGLKRLNCANNTNITVLPALPSGLWLLNCGINKLTALPTLPADLQYLVAAYNQLTTLPALPARLKTMTCHFNQLTGLPALPDSLTTLWCSNNLLTSLPALPRLMTYLETDHNQLTSLPDLPDTMNRLIFSDNDIHCVPRLPAGIYDPTLYTTQARRLDIQLDAAKIPCIPNLPAGTTINANASYPLCTPINNPNSCVSYPVLKGIFYNDLNKNGIKDAGESVVPNARGLLSNGDSVFTDFGGQYQIAADALGMYSFAPAVSLFTSSPASAQYIFNRLDTLVTQDYGLQLTALPLQLISFTGISASNKNVTLYWTTANELNARNFIIEQSEDGVHFNQVAVENARNQVSGNYQKQFNSLAKNLLYFRLKMVDMEGNYSYSKILSVKVMSVQAAFSFQKNPVVDFLNVKLDDASLQNTWASILNAQGALVQRVLLQHPITKVNVAGLSAGIYILQTEKGNLQFVVIK